MTEISTLGYALLGLLAREPLSGYDLAQRLDLTVGFFWHARHSQIYPELKRLQRARLVTHEKVAQHDRPDKKVYALTDRGQERLQDWVTAPFEPAGKRDELLLKVYSVWLADPAQAARLIREQERLHEEQLRAYRAHEAELHERYPTSLRDPRSPRFATWATLKRGLGYETEYVAWCRWLADALEAATSR